MKIALGIPAHGSVKPQMLGSLLLATHGLPHDLNIIIQESCYVHENREKIAERAVDLGCDLLMFIDADMWFEADAIAKLIAADKHIIGANYNERHFPLTGTVKIAGSDGKLIACPLEEIPKTQFKCYAVATGLMLVKIAVFNTMPKPWFWFENTDGDMMSEDIWFCREAQRAGFEVWCDPTINVKHIGDMAY